MNLVSLLLAFAPGIAITIMILWELPEWIKRLIYSIIPSWALSLLLCVIVGSFVNGVLGPFSAFITDIMVSFTIIYDHHKMQKNDLKIKAKADLLKRNKN